MSIWGSAKRLFSGKNSSTQKKGGQIMNTIKTAISGHKVVSRKEWLEARKKLLKREKESTRLRDQLSAERRKLPWVKVEKQYVFDAPQGKVRLADLFDGRSQLVIYHFMFGPDWKEGCPSCSFVSDHIDGTLAHLAARDVTIVIVSRAPLGKIEAFKKRMGWRFKWVSSYGSDFNPDFCVSFTKDEMAQGKVNYNYTTQEFPSEEAPGVSVFYRDPGGDLFHTYSTYGRGVEQLVGTYMILDIVPKGRDEDHLGFTMEWVRHHDRYGTDEFADANKPYWPATTSPSPPSGSCGSNRTVSSRRPFEPVVIANTFHEWKDGHDRVCLRSDDERQLRSLSSIESSDILRSMRSQEFGDQNPEALRDQYQALLEVTESIASHRDLSELFHDLAQPLRNVLHFDYLSVRLHDLQRKAMLLQ